MWRRGDTSAPGAQLSGGAAHAPGAAPSAGLLRNEGLLGHLANHVVEDAPVAEIRELHVGVKPHDSLESLPSIQLDLDFHSWFEVFWNVDSVSFPPCESQGVCSLPREIFEGNHPHSD